MPRPLPSQLCLLALLAAGCETSEIDEAEGSDGGAFDGGAFDGGAFDGAFDRGATDVDAGGLPATYGDGECSDQEFAEGEEAIAISESLANEGPGWVSAYIDMHRERLDAIWADCFERFCPIALEVHDECLASFDYPDAGADVSFPEPSCYAPPPECDAFR